VKNVEKVLNEILLKLGNLDSNVATLTGKVSNLETKVGNLETGVGEIKEIVTRIEVSQNEDVIALLKTFNGKIDAKTEALNKRLYDVETRLEASN
jgi:hypothetical protein